MTTRKKSVFNNSQLAHVWAQGTHAHGRNPSNTFYFDGYKIYSYGSHYLAAQIHNMPKKAKAKMNSKAKDIALAGQGRFALVNSHNYSNSTAKHLSCIRSALHQKMQYFHVKDPSNLKQAVKDVDAAIIANIGHALSKKKITNTRSIDFFVDNILEAQKTANCLRELLGRKKVKSPHNDIKRVIKHLNARFKRYEELNTPEELAKKALKREKLELKKAELNAQKMQQAIDDFYTHKNTQVFDHTLKYDLLRVQTRISDGSRDIQTSRGAIVPYNDALKLFTEFMAKTNAGRHSTSAFIGAGVGAFKIDFIGRDERTMEVFLSIGCHKILLSELANLFSKEERR